MTEDKKAKVAAAWLTFEVTFLIVTAWKWVPFLIRVVKSVINFRYSTNVGLGI